MKPQVIALPGIVAPAAQRYAPVVSALGGEVEVHLKDLEVYSGTQTPPPGYSIESEIAAVARLADSLGLERFHLLAYSGGGFVSLAFAGAHPDRVLSLAMFEPAGIPGPPTEAEAQRRRRLDAALKGLSGAEFMRTFMKVQVKPGVELAPPAGPPLPWMATRPAGIAAMMAASASHPFDRARLTTCEFPVFYGYGDLTGEYEPVKAATLAQLVPDIHIRRFPGIHHFVTPEELYTEAHLAELRRLWTGLREGVSVS